VRRGFFIAHLPRQEAPGNTGPRIGTAGVVGTGASMLLQNPQAPGTSARELNFGGNLPLSI